MRVLIPTSRIRRGCISTLYYNIITFRLNRCPARLQHTRVRASGVVVNREMWSGRAYNNKTNRCNNGGVTLLLASPTGCAYII